MTLRDIRRRIRSILNTQQITRAMEMVAASKLRRFQAQVLAGRPYAARLGEVLQEVSAAAAETGEEELHPYLAARPVGRRAMVLVTADRGLCGSFNSNLLRRALAAAREAGPGGLGFVLVGKKGCDALKRAPVETLAKFPVVGREVTPAFVSQLAETVSRLFLERAVDRVDLLYTRFISAMNRELVEEPLLPVTAEEARRALERAQSGAGTAAGRQGMSLGPRVATGTFLLEPSPEEIFRVLMPRYLRNRLFAALRESFASEQGARMTAMGTATRNAEELVETMTLEMNRARQATITKELADIVGSAEAMR